MKKAMSFVTLAAMTITAIFSTSNLEASRHRSSQTTVVYREVPVAPPARYYVAPPQRVYVEAPRERIYVEQPAERIYVEQPRDVVVVRERRSCPESFLGGAFMGFVLGALTH